MKRKYIEENLELIGEDFLSDFTEALISKDSDKTLGNLAFLREKSLDVRLFLEQFLFFLRDRMKESLKKQEFGSYAELFGVFENIYGRLKFSPDQFLLLETGTFRYIVPYSTVLQELPIREKKDVDRSTASSIKKKDETISDRPPIGKEQDVADLQKKDDSKAAPDIQGSGERKSIGKKPENPFDFSKFIGHIRTVPKRSFVGLGLRVSTYSEEGDTIVIYPDNDFNYKKLDSADVRIFLQETLDTLFGV